jgi:hypothetical protein
MKCLIFSVLVLLTSFNLQAQGTRSLGLTLKSGMGVFNRISNEDDLLRPNQITTSPGFAWGILVDAEKQFSKRISGQTQLGYNNIRSYESEAYSIINVETNTTTNHTNETKRNAHFVSLNSIVNVHPTEKISIGMGLSINFHLSNSFLTNGYANNTLSYVNSGGNDLLKLDLALNPQIGYRLADNLKLYAAAQFGLFNLRDPELTDAYSRETGLDSGNEILLKSQVYTLGLKYTIFKDKV